MAVSPRGPLIRMLVRPVAIRRNVGFDVFNVRLLVGLDKLLRAKRRYQGDLSASINDALLAVDLNTVKLVVCPVYNLTAEAPSLCPRAGWIRA